MAGEYVDRDTLKSWFKSPVSVDDALLDMALSGATEWIDESTGRSFNLEETASTRAFRAQGRTYWTDDGLHAFVVDDIGSLDGLVVETGSTGGTWNPVTGYDTSPDNAFVHGRPVTALLRMSGWPCDGTQRLRITARWGWPSVPDDVRQACLIQATRLFHRRNSPEGVLGGSSEWGVVQVTRVDPDAKALINPFCLPGFA